MKDTDPIHDAIQEWHRADGRDPDYVVTDFTITYAAVNFRTADTTTYVSTVSHGAAHVTLGLAHVGLRDAEAQFEGGDDD